MKVTKTLKLRVKDKHCNALDHKAKAVNFFWNYVNELSLRSIVERRTFLSEFDLHPYTKGAGKELGLHSQTLKCIAKEYVTRRKQFKKVRLN
jgi:putative transposase